MTITNDRMTTDDARQQILAALQTMPEEAFGWFVLATREGAMPQGAHCQIWPDGIGGFTDASRRAIAAVRTAASAYVEAIRAGARP